MAEERREGREGREEVAFVRFVRGFMCAGLQYWRPLKMNRFEPLSLDAVAVHCAAPSEMACAAPVTVVIPCFRQASTVLETIRSVRAQGCNTTVFLIDDDPPRHACAALVESRVSSATVIRNPSNYGLAATRNRALALVTTPYVLFLDSDDMLAKNYLALASQRAEDQQADLVAADQILYRKQSAMRWRLQPKPSRAFMGRNGPLPIPNLLRTTWFRSSVGGFDEDMVVGSEDYTTWLRILMDASSRVEYLGEVGSCYRITPGSMMRSPSYRRLSRSFVISKVPELYSRQQSCEALTNIATHIDTGLDTGRRLEQAVANNPRSCSAVAWLALWKLRVGCSVDVASLLRQGSQRCTSNAVHLDAVVAWHSQGYPKKSLSSVCLSDESVRASSPPAPAAYTPYSVSTMRDTPPSYRCPATWTAGKGGAASRPAIPRIVHFVYGMMPQARPMPESVAIAVGMAHIVYFPARVMFHVSYTPLGVWWERVKSIVEVHVHAVATVATAQNRCLLHYAHRADVLRLRVLEEFGGVYLDTDVIALRPLPLNTSRFLIPWQDSPAWSWRKGSLHYGMCNAVMASEPGSSAVRALLRNYGSFRSYGRDEFWDEHSVRLVAEVFERCDPPAREWSALRFDDVLSPLWSSVGELYRNRRLPSIESVYRLYPRKFAVHLWYSDSHGSQVAGMQSVYGQVSRYVRGVFAWDGAAS